MKKIRKVTTINTPRSNHVKAAIYEHEGFNYILASIYEVYRPFAFGNKLYSQVKCIQLNPGGTEFWHIV